MTDDTTHHATHDRSRINMGETGQIEYWTAKFGVDPAELAEAVQAVGPGALAVANYLGKHL